MFELLCLKCFVSMTKRDDINYFKHKPSVSHDASLTEKLITSGTEIKLSPASFNENIINNYYCIC